MAFTKIRLVLLIAILFVAGVPWANEPAPDAQTSMIFIYRPSAFALGGRSATVEIDGNHVIDVGNNRHVAVTVAPGVHDIFQFWPESFDFSNRARNEGIRISLTSQAGEKHYIRLSVTSRQVRAFTEFTWILQEVPEAIAVVELAKTKPQRSRARRAG